MNTSSSSNPSNPSRTSCVVNEGQNCKDCDLEGKILCRFTRSETIKFIIGNTAYRLTALGIFFFLGFMLKTWWMMWGYGALVALTFIILEPRLLCSHCPFYTKPGKILTCGGLYGMPKWWKYHPEPIKPWEKIIMLILGSVIDLVPFLGMIGGVILFLLHISEYLIYGIGLTIFSILFLGLAYYFSKVLLGDRCKRCPNFSCAMNKVPKELVMQFLEKNTVMQKAWEQSGYFRESNKKID